MTRIASAKDLGKAIKAARLRSGLTQRQIAELSGVGYRFIVDVEGGKTTVQFDKALTVAQALGLQFEAHGPSVLQAPAVKFGIPALRSTLRAAS